MKILIKNIIYCHTACLWTVYLRIGMSKSMAGFSAFVLTTGNIFFRSMPKQMEIAYSTTQHLCNSLVHKRRVMTAVKWHLYATYAQHLALKSVYEKRQVGGKLFSSKIKFELKHFLEHPKEVTWIACMRHLLREALTICQDRVFASFLCVLSLSSVLGS